jgi:hypothetical protein
MQVAIKNRGDFVLEHLFQFMVGIPEDAQDFGNMPIIETRNSSATAVQTGRELSQMPQRPDCRSPQD